MTRGDGPYPDVPPGKRPPDDPSAGPGRPGFLPPTSMFDNHAFDRERERTPDHRGGRWDPRERDLPSFRARDGPSPRDVATPRDLRNSDRDFGRDGDRDLRGRDGGRGYDNYNHGGISNLSRGEPSRGMPGDFGRGLGFVSGEEDRRVAWERDLGSGRGRGRGRGRSRGGSDGEGADISMSFVRGEVLNRDGPLDFDRGREWERNGRGRDWDRGRDIESDFDRDRDADDRERKSDRSNNLQMQYDRGDNSEGAGRGRGRGRGRGMHVNRPAWMSSDARIGSHGGAGESANDYKDTGDFASPSKSRSETMELLLAQARQVKEQSSSRIGDVKDSLYSPQNSSRSSKNNKAVELEKQPKLEEEENARNSQEAADEERKRLEKMREEEEEKQLRALIDEVSGNDGIQSGNNDYTGLKRTSRDADGDEIIQFETNEEKEERLARKRREERRKKLRQLDSGTMPDGMNVDLPRNTAGLVESEMNGNKGDDSNAQGVKEIIFASATSSEQKLEQQQSEVYGINKNQQTSTTIPDNDSDDDSFDMFAPDKSTPIPSEYATSSQATRNNNSNTMSSRNAQDCDDAEGYYKASIGEIITLPKYVGDREYYGSRDEINETGRYAKFRVLGIIGKGVFSSVIKCVEVDSGNSDLTSSTDGVETGHERIIAMKIIRNNEIMAKAAAKEMRILRMLCRPSERKSTKGSKKNSEGSTSNGADNGDSMAGITVDDEEDSEERDRRERENHNIVRLLEVESNVVSSNRDHFNPYSSSAYVAPPPEFRSHCVFLFEFLPYNLREVLSKFGKNVGINLTAVRSYARQLMCALSHLEKHRVVHADLKPDNILVSSNFSTVKLADFGSAFFETDHDNDPTPYLVSRFYRPPEVILGLEYDRMVDLWSTSVTLAELFTGTVLFPGNSNNDMLVKFMDAMGPFSHKMVRRHAASYTRMGLTPHFEVGLTGGTYQLRKHDVDRVTGQPVVRMVNVLSAKPEARLAQVMLKASRGSGGNSERVEVMKFADFLTRCLALDPARRLSVRDALKHEFFIRKKKKDA